MNRGLRHLFYFNTKSGCYFWVVLAGEVPKMPFDDTKLERFQTAGAMELNKKGLPEVFNRDPRRVKALKSRLSAFELLYGYA